MATVAALVLAVLHTVPPSATTRSPRRPGCCGCGCGTSSCTSPPTACAPVAVAPVATWRRRQIHELSLTLTNEPCDFAVDVLREPIEEVVMGRRPRGHPQFRAERQIPEPRHKFFRRDAPIAVHVQASGEPAPQIASTLTRAWATSTLKVVDREDSIAIRVETCPQALELAKTLLADENLAIAEAGEPWIPPPESTGWTHGNRPTRHNRLMQVPA